MATEIVVPELGESVIEATVARWLKQEGDTVSVGEALVELETDKVNLEVGAESDGVLAAITALEGSDVTVGDVLGRIEVRESEPAPSSEELARSADSPEASKAAREETPEPEPVAAPHRAGNGQHASPVARRMAQAEGVDLAEVEGTGPQNRVTKGDVQRYLDDEERPLPKKKDRPGSKREQTESSEPSSADRERREERVRLSRRRRTIAARLVEAQQTAAMLTTFNDADMSAVMGLRARRKGDFQERHGVRLGIASFFVRAAVGALKAFPRLNAEIDGDEMVLKNYYDIGVAIGDPEGLVVPILRDADRMTFAEIEEAIRRYAKQVEEGMLSLADLRGGTFTITNGGVFGSLLSTPILNPPQVGILGLHRIEDRPAVVDGEMVIRPMMYLALTYDHRIVDGREAVQFLGRVKDLIEDPETLLLEG